MLDRHATTNQEIKTFCGKFRRVELKKRGGGGGIFSHKPSQSQNPVGLHGAKKSGDPIGSLSTR